MILIKNGHVVGAAGGPADVLIEGDRVVAICENLPSADGTTVIDAAGCIVAPGLVDMHVHFRDPGYEYKEDVFSGAAAAAAGGVTTCCCMPNTSPVIDNAKIVKRLLKKAGDAAVTVVPYGAVTLGQKGVELTDFASLKKAGVIALSDDGNPVQNARLMYIAMQAAREADMLIVSHCEDADLAQNFAVNEGKVSWELMIPGRPAIAEEIMVARDAMLAAKTGARVHIAHVSAAGSVEIIRKAKTAGMAITAETCPQYFTLTEDEILTQGALARVNPPLRTKADAEAVIDGLEDGTIDAIATDHAPHSAEEKALPLEEAPSGMIGLETSLALALTHLYHTGKLGMEKIIELMSVNPARILGIGCERRDDGGKGCGDGRGDEGGWGVGIAGAASAFPLHHADIVVFDPDKEWTVRPEKFRSKARNTPFGGMKLRGKVMYTISRGKVVYSP